MAEKPARRDWTQREVVQLLLELGRELQGHDAQLSELEQDYVRKAEAYNVAHTQAFLKARSGVDDRGKNNPQYVCQAMADNETSELKLAMDIAEVMVKGQKRKIEILRERIGIGRTATASLRAELELERTPNQYRR